jgi:DNA gyrase/topoisomerase IV subunit B
MRQMDENLQLEIFILEGLDAIRCRINMYLGELEREDLFEDLVFEALCHAIDESVDNNCKNIQIYIEDISGAVSIHYDAGISLDINTNTGKSLVVSLFTELLACHNLKKHIEVGSKYCQYGLAVLNAVCSHLEVDTIKRGQRSLQTYIKGKLTEDFLVPSKLEDTERTNIRFFFDDELLGKHEIHLDRLKLKAQELIQDCGLKIDISDISDLISPSSDIDQYDF